MIRMLYDIYVNEEKVATVGPADLEHFHISVSSSNRENEPFLSANGMTEKSKDGFQLYHTWLEGEIKPTDRVLIVPTETLHVSDPIKTRKLRRNQKATKEHRFCDFCKQEEAVVGRVVQAGDTPFICAHCAELVLEIIRGNEE